MLSPDEAVHWHSCSPEAQQDCFRSCHSSCPPSGTICVSSTWPWTRMIADDQFALLPSLWSPPILIYVSRRFQKALTWGFSLEARCLRGRPGAGTTPSPKSGSIRGALGRAHDCRNRQTGNIVTSTKLGELAKWQLSFPVSGSTMEMHNLTCKRLVYFYWHPCIYHKDMILLFYC